MTRMVLSDTEWEKIESLLPKCKVKGYPGRPRLNDRLIIEGILWVHRTGAPWRDLPRTFGPWTTVYSRFTRWTKAGVFDNIWICLKKTKRIVNRI
jgi:transposase